MENLLTLKLAKKLSRIRHKLQKTGLSKTGSVSMGNYGYKYYQFDCLAKAIFPLLNELEITFSFSVVPNVPPAMLEKDDKIHVSYLMCLVLESGEESHKTFAMAYGSNADAGKANGSASTYAKRLLLMNTFAIVEADREG